MRGYRQAKDKFDLVQQYLIVSDDLSRAAAYSEGLETGYNLSHKKMRRLKSALKELLGLGVRNRDEALKYARAVINE